MIRIETAARASSLSTSAAACATFRSRRLHWPVLLIWAMPLLNVGGQGDGTRKVKAAHLSALGAPRIDACEVLTRREIEIVQGEPVVETKPSVSLSSGMLISQCLFRTATFANSVSVTVATPDPAKPTARSPREFWQQQFHPHEAPGEKRPAGGEEWSNSKAGREEEHRTRLISGLGEEAYWVDSPIGDALYVLQGDAYARISIGGARSESVSMKKAKALGRAVVKRLRSATVSSRSRLEGELSR